MGHTESDLCMELGIEDEWTKKELKKILVIILQNVYGTKEVKQTGKLLFDTVKWCVFTSRLPV